MVRHTGEMHPGDALDTDHRLRRVAADGRRLIDVSARDLAAPVPSCPGWTTTDLLAHVGRVWRSVTAHVARESTEMIPGTEIPEAPPGPAVVEFADEGLAQLLDVLTAADPATRVWTWAARQDVGFYQRRMHQETLVHRVDAELALDDPTPVDTDDGADGVDELCEVMLAGRSGDALPGGSLHLHRTDGDGEWLLEVVDGVVGVRPEHTKGDAALRGTGDELLLVMWGRRPLEGVECFGDAAVARAWVDLV